ncbi:type II secretion system F family protein [Gordonia neofelifaecis]|uniref:Type II secretion system protein GspF domain-containing protein n=1 Tax=Gordonia neofelifaecis NRRL B-59395 TaxID=644548 RepID=F1YJY4_9ACTN|nr:type II secretion system F family protein [Gordonia neofelifaecis]EGD55066.1 hypothetical protein SCNU_11071 [Gordonia neofelifaecis NRRL B-59395]
MTAAAVLVALAAVLLWWPVPEAYRRLAGLVAEERGMARRMDPWLLVWVLPAAALLVFGVAPGVAGALVAGLVTRQRRRSCREALADRDSRQLIAALAVMSAELSVGAPVVQACRAAAADLARIDHDGAVGPELARMAARAELGGDPGPESATRAGPVRRLARSWAVSLEYGLPVGDVLAALREDLVSRQDFAARTRAGLAGPRATAVVLAGLPVVGLVLGQAMGAHPARVLLESRIGGVLLVVGTALSVAGVVWADRIADQAVRR